MGRVTPNLIEAAWRQGQRHAAEGRSDNPHKAIPALARAWRAGFYGLERP